MYGKTIEPTIHLFTSIISAREVEGSSVDKLKEEFKTAINLDEVGGGFKTIFATRRGTLVVESNSQNQKDLLDGKLATNATLKTTEFSKRNPSMIFTGVDSSLSQEEVMKDIRTKNKAFVDIFKGEFETKFKVVASKVCRNPSRRNYFVEVTPDVYEACSAVEKLNIGLTRHSFIEHISIRRCFQIGRAHV